MAKRWRYVTNVFGGGWVEVDEPDRAENVFGVGEAGPEAERRAARQRAARRDGLGRRTHKPNDLDPNRRGRPS
jgi:hypothetical protein